MNILQPWNIVFLVGFVVYTWIRHVFIERTKSEKKAVSRIDRLENDGQSVVVIGSENHVCGLIAVSDAFDALTSDRPYRSARPVEKAIPELKRCKGTQFNPKVVDAFVSIIEQQHFWETEKGLSVQP